MMWRMLLLALLAGCTGGVAERGGAPTGPQVDRSAPALSAIEFRADQADPAAREALGLQLAFLDRAVEPKGLLIVYLHGAGEREVCGEGTRGHERLLAGMGFHVLSPCYRADYDLEECGAAVRGCRLEAFDAIDRSDAIDIRAADSIERRVVMGLRHLQARDPGGDWQFFLDGGQPRWPAIVLSGRSHGASSAGLIAKHRGVARSVMLAGPLDRDQDWLGAPSITPLERFYAFSHEADPQFEGHLEAWARMGLRGPPTSVDGAAPPYGGAHQLTSAAPTVHAHSAVVVGGSTPRADDGLLYQPVWRYLYDG